MKLFNIFKRVNQIKPSKDDSKSILPELSKANLSLVPKGILDEILGSDLGYQTEKIKIIREHNIEKQNMAYEQALFLNNKGRHEEAIKLSSSDYIGFVGFYYLAEKEEKKQNFQRAAEIYWYNLYHNGTDAPANFRRLLILLRKMKEYRKELRVAELYKRFVNPSMFEEINKRIATIKTKMNN